MLLIRRQVDVVRCSDKALKDCHYSVKTDLYFALEHPHEEQCKLLVLSLLGWREEHQRALVESFNRLYLLYQVEFFSRTNNISRGLPTIDRLKNTLNEGDTGTTLRKNAIIKKIHSTHANLDTREHLVVCAPEHHHESILIFLEELLRTFTQMTVANYQVQQSFQACLIVKRLSSSSKAKEPNCLN